MLQPLERAWMEVDLGAVVRNTTALKSHAGVPVIPMIKADAYGIGAKQVAHALESIEPLAYGVATILFRMFCNRTSIQHQEVRLFAEFHQPIALTLQIVGQHGGFGLAETAAQSME